MGWAALAGGAISLINSKNASDSAERSADKAAGLTRDQMQRLADINLPDEEKMKILLENPELMGVLNAENIDDSKYGEIQLDPALRQNQMAALESLKQRGEEGLTAQDKYQMEQLLGDVTANERSGRASIEADMARRGMDSSGASLMAKLQGSQSGANQARDRAMQMAAQGQQNKLAALQALGQQSGQMSQQDFAQQSQIASAQDAIARANAMNRQNVSGQNLAARQSIENQRANLVNQQHIYNKGLEQQQFDNKLKKAGQQNIASTNAANTASSVAATQAQASADMFKTGANLAGTYFQNREAADGGIISKENLPIQYQQRATEDEYRAAETKQHESFKKKYMKRIQDEVMGSSPKSETPAKPQTKKSYADGGSYYSDGTGGIVDSGNESYAGDRVDAKINDKEIVVNVPQQQRLMDLLRGKISVDELGTDDIVEGVPREYRDNMHEELEEESAPEEEDKLQTLLRMLGK